MGGEGVIHLMDILLVDDHAAMRAEMAALIKAQKDLDVVGNAENGEEGVRMAERLRPDAIVMDIVMPGMNGIAATQAIRANNPTARILVLSNQTGANLVKIALNAGATGYVRKDRAYEELIPAIRAVAQGIQYVGEGVTE